MKIFGEKVPSLNFYVVVLRGSHGELSVSEQTNVPTVKISNSRFRYLLVALGARGRGGY